MQLYCLCNGAGERYIFAGDLDELTAALRWPSPPKHPAYRFFGAPYEVELLLPHDKSESSMLAFMYANLNPVNRLGGIRHPIHVFRGGQYQATFPSLRAVGRAFALSTFTSRVTNLAWGAAKHNQFQFLIGDRNEGECNRCELGADLRHARDRIGPA